MNKAILNTNKSYFEKNSLIVLVLMFVLVLFAAWGYALRLRQTLVVKSAVAIGDPSALIAIERMHNLVESQAANGRAFFLLGSRAIYEKQKMDKQQLADAVSSFQKKYNLPLIPDVLKRLATSLQQQQEVFNQAIEFREKQTESKIVGHFYHSKMSPLLKQFHDGLDEISRLQSAELDRIRTEAQESASGLEQQIPKGMMWLTGSLIFVFFGLSILVLRLLGERKRHLGERDRLYLEAQKSALARDEFVAAISHDLKEPLGHLNQIAEILVNFSDSSPVRDSGELIKSTVNEVDSIVKNISDQKTADLEGLNLRMDQLSVDEILEDSYLLMQPIAKRNDVRLQFESANPPVLAFMDRERVIRVLSHLVRNAIKFSPKHGKVVVKVRSDQQFVNISVIDSGPGISEKKLSVLFDHFWQARKTADQGAGIGLAVVKRIVEAHGGTVRATSGLGHGSTFTFSLPRRRPASGQLKKPAPIRYTTNPRPQMEI